MNKLIIFTTGLFLISGNTFAAGSHAGGHGKDEVKLETHGLKDTKEHGHENTDSHHEGVMAVGIPGKNQDVSKDIVILMKETDDGDMIFTPKSIDVQNGQTIRFVVQNVGELVHEFVLDNHDGVIEHKALMEKFPEMEHDDPNSIRLEPGEKGEVIWKFSNGGAFEFACLIPGHYASGMRGDIMVSKIDNSTKSH